MKTKYFLPSLIVIGLLINILGFTVRGINVQDDFVLSNQWGNDSFQRNANADILQTFIIYGVTNTYYDINTFTWKTGVLETTTGTMTLNLCLWNETNEEVEEILYTHSSININTLTDNTVYNIDIDLSFNLSFNIYYCFYLDFYGLGKNGLFIKYNDGNNSFSVGDMYIATDFASYIKYDDDDLFFGFTSIGVDLVHSDPIDTNVSYGWENITSMVFSDNTITDVNLIVTYPNWTIYNYSMIEGTSNSYYYNTTFDSCGKYVYYVWCKDDNDEQGYSDIYYYYKPPNYDIDMNGVINIIDFSKISLKWLWSGSNGIIREDINNDGNVNIVDLSIISIHWLEQWNTTGIPSPIGTGVNWRMVSIPFNQTISKYDVNFTNATHYYTWEQAVNNNVIQDNLYGWSTSGYYELKTSFVAYKGYFIYLYEPDYNICYNFSCGGGSGATGTIWVNYTDNNITFNVSINLDTMVNESNYTINSTNWLDLLYGNISFEDEQFFLIILLTLWCFLLYQFEKTNKHKALYGTFQFLISVPIFSMFFWNAYLSSSSLGGLAFNISVGMVLLFAGLFVMILGWWE